MSTANEEPRCVWINFYALNEEGMLITDRAWSLDEAKQLSQEQARHGWQLIARRKITEGDFDE